MMNTDGPDPIDIHVGQRLKQRRTLLGMSQTKLADALGITFQQVQKYESGTNRVGASRLYQLGKVLSVSVEFFFDEFRKGAAAGATPAFAVAEDTPTPLYEDDIMKRKETIDLVRAYYAIENEELRKKMLAMMKSAS